MLNLNVVKRVLYFLAFTQMFLLTANAQNIVFTGKVTNEKGNPVPWAKITLPTGEFTVSDVNGKFKLKVKEKPSIPMQATVVKQGYVLKGLEYYEETSSIEVTMESVSSKPTQKYYVKVFDEDNKPFPSVSLYLDGKTFTTDNYGI